MDPSLLADPIIRTLLTRAGSSLARRVFEVFIGTARQREFEQALRSAVSRLTARYPRIGSTSADIDFFARADVVDRLFALVVLGAEHAGPPIASSLRDTYETGALLQDVPPDQVIAELAALLEEELVALGTFADQFTHRNTQEILRRLEDLVPQESDAVRSLRRLRAEILRGPLGSVLDPELRQREHAASLALLPRPGESVRVQVDLRLAFPPTPEGTAAQHAFERSVTAGHPLSLAGSYIELAKVTLNGAPFPGWSDQRPQELHLESVARPAPARFTLYREGVEVASIDVLSLRLIRSGTSEDYFEADASAPLHATVTVRRTGTQLQARMNFATTSSFRDAVEQWRVFHFLSCLARADRCTWEILGTEVRQSGAVRAGADPLSVNELAYAKALALIQEASGVKLPPLLTKDRHGVMQLLALARAMRRGYSVGTIEAAHVRFPEEVAQQFRQLEARRATFSFATLLRERKAKFPGVSIELGPVLQYMASVRVVELVPGKFSLLPGGSARALEIYYRWTEFAMPTEEDFGQFGIGAPNAPPLRFLRPKSG